MRPTIKSFFVSVISPIQMLTSRSGFCFHILLVLIISVLIVSVGSIVVGSIHGGVGGSASPAAIGGRTQRGGGSSFLALGLAVGARSIV